MAKDAIINNANGNEGVSKTGQGPVDNFAEFVSTPVTKLDADQYSAEDLDGVVQSVFSSGNMNFLIMQGAQTNTLGHQQDAVAPVTSEIDAVNGQGIVTSNAAPGHGDASLSAPIGAGHGDGYNNHENQFSNATFGALGADHAVSGTNGTAGSAGLDGKDAISSDRGNVGAVNGVNGNNGFSGKSGSDGGNGSDGSDGGTGNTYIYNYGTYDSHNVYNTTTTITYTDSHDTYNYNDSHDINILNDINIDHVVENVTNVIGNSGDTISNAVSQVVNVVGDVATIVDGVVGMIDDNVNNVFETVDNSLATVSNVLDNVSGVLNGATGTVNNIFTTLGGAVNAVIVPVGGIVNNFGSTVTQLGNTVSSTVNTAIGPVTDMANSVTNTVNTLGDTVISTTGTVTSIVSGLAGPVPHLANTLSQAGDAITTVVTDIQIGHVTGDLAAVFTHSGDTINNVVIPIADQINHSADIVPDIQICDISTVLQTVTTDISAAVDVVIENLPDIPGLPGLPGVPPVQGNPLGELDLFSQNPADHDVGLNVLGHALPQIVINPVEDLAGDIDLGIRLDLTPGGISDNTAGDGDLIVNDITYLADGPLGSVDLSIPLTPVETVLGTDVDISIGAGQNLLGQAAPGMFDLSAGGSEELSLLSAVGSEGVLHDLATDLIGVHENAGGADTDVTLDLSGGALETWSDAFGLSAFIPDTTPLGQLGEISLNLDPVENIVGDIDLSAGLGVFLPAQATDSVGGLDASLMDGTIVHVPVIDTAFAPLEAGAGHTDINLDGNLSLLPQQNGGNESDSLSSDIGQGVSDLIETLSPTLAQHLVGSGAEGSGVSLGQGDVFSLGDDAIGASTAGPVTVSLSVLDQLTGGHTDIGVNPSLHQTDVAGSTSPSDQNDLSVTPSIALGDSIIVPSTEIAIPFDLVEQLTGNTDTHINAAIDLLSAAPQATHVITDVASNLSTAISPIAQGTGWTESVIPDASHSLGTVASTTTSTLGSVLSTPVGHVSDGLSSLTSSKSLTGIGDHSHHFKGLFG